MKCISVRAPTIMVGREHQIRLEDESCTIRWPNAPLSIVTTAMEPWTCSQSYHDTHQMLLQCCLGTNTELLLQESTTSRPEPARVVGASAAVAGGLYQLIATSMSAVREVLILLNGFCPIYHHVSLKHLQLHAQIASPPIVEKHSSVHFTPAGRKTNTHHV